MNLIEEAVFSSTTYWGIGFFDYREISHKVKMSIKEVGKRHRQKYKQKGIIPIPVLKAFWHLGCLPGEDMPQQGMRVLVLVEYLKSGNYRDRASSEKGRWLYDSIIKDELCGPGMQLFRWPEQE